MHKFKSRFHTIDAFQFLGHKTIAPDWFIEQVTIGKASVTMSHKDSYISIYGEDQEEKAREGSWVCRSSNGKIYALDETRFNGSYEKT